MRTRHGSKRRQIEKASQVTSETRRCTEDLVPTDLVSEILRRLPAKSVGRFLLVSKLWATIIRSPYFVRSFPFRSSLLPPILMAFKYLDNQNGRLNWNFRSYSSTSTKEPAYHDYHLSDLRTTCSSSIPHDLLRNINKVPYYVNGLISIGCGREQLICNPSTGKSILLPKVKSRKVIIKSFFGYDPVDSQYKVLCMSEKVYNCWDGSSLEHQVFTLGGVDKSWRMIECNVLKRPTTNGVCIDGVVYYSARATPISEWCLVRFNVRSEKFDQVLVVQHMGDYSPLSYRDISLMSYKGKVTFAIEITQQRFELWVLEDIEKREWSKICIFINHMHSLSLVGHVQIIRETTHTGEIVFVWHHLEDLYMVFYDHKTNSYRISNKIQGNSDKEFGRFSLMIPFFNYVESVMLL